MNDPRSHWSGRFAAVALIPLLAASPAPLLAQAAGGPDAAKLLEQLKALEDSITKARSGNNVSALTTITDAASSDSKALALWLESVRETEFRDQDKKESEFRAWRDGPGRRLSEPGAGSAIRLHLQYLALTIRVANASSDIDRSDIFTALLSYLDDLSRADKNTLRNRQALDSSVLSTPVARRFKLDRSVRPPEAWSLVPGNLGAIYDTAILPYLREKKDLARLQTAWSRRLQQEATQVATQNSEPVTKNYREVELPALEWAQARDLFLAGSPAAATKMLQIIQQNQVHKDVPKWITDLRSLLSGGGGTPASSPPAGGAESESTTPPELPDDEAAEVPTASPDPSSETTPGRPPRPRGLAPGFPPNRTR